MKSSIAVPSVVAMLLLSAVVLGADAKPSATDPDPAAIRRAVEHLSRSFGDRYPRGKEFLDRLAKLEAAPDREALETLRRDALLANPLLDFDRLLLVRRALKPGDPKVREGKYSWGGLGLTQNWQGNKGGAFDNEIAVLSPARPGGKIQSLYRPQTPRFVGDVDLHFDGKRMLFSSQDERSLFQIFEISAEGGNPRQVTKGDQPDVQNYDACYLPSDKIIFASTACMQGVPCVGGSDPVANLCVMDPDGGNVRQLCFDQDHNWHPTVMNDGAVMFTRWEYSDTPHYFTRLLFRMNPDGIGQTALYGSNSYWPNSVFYARPVPGHPTKVVGIVSGHHGVRRMGELVVFDVGRGQHEADGAIQKIPGYGKPVKPVMGDNIADASWPKFLHPYPLSAEYFLVSAALAQGEPWGIYLVDVFDNMVCLAEEPGMALLEPVPFRATRRPPVIPERVNLASREATVYMNDLYHGPGLKDVPRGTIKSLRVYAFHYGYQRLAGHTCIGIDGPWDVRQILGTVSVEADGSALFKVPANTPVAVQPLDAEGRAMQVMRSWYTAMPGETISCAGCHERQNDVPRMQGTLAKSRKPSDLRPWFGPVRGFSFKREVQPVLDHFCVGCHDGGATLSGHKPDLRPGKQGDFTTAYTALHPYVRRPGPESDYHIMPPAEYAANTSELIQLLKKGHHGVRLPEEAWQRLYTWIDLNVPDHGTWSEFRDPGQQRERRVALRNLYTNGFDDPEVIPQLPPPAFAKLPKPATQIKPRPAHPLVKLAGWPLSTDAAKKRQLDAAPPPPAPASAPARPVAPALAALARIERSIDLGGVPLKLMFVPAGEFVMGSNEGDLDEGPAQVMKIGQPFWMGKFEVSNEQYALFDSGHDSRYISKFGKDQSNRGIPANAPKQPVIRVSWMRAAAFCEWLSEKTGERFSLPTEAQWEYACRAGTATAMNFGPVDTNYSTLANLADESVSKHLNAKWLLRDANIQDGAIATAWVGRYPPGNAWGLCEMHGNVAEWTTSVYKPYPYRADDGREMSLAHLARFADKPGEAWPSMVVRGGSWYDRAKRATSSYRLAYPAWQGVYNVGFRVVTAAGASGGAVAKMPMQ
jgi:formylglycine-generating enzyme required for sulfatase activity